MLHPVGKLPPAVYWKRRLIFVGLPLLFVVLMIVALMSGGGDKKDTATRTSSSRTSASPTPGSTSVPPTTPASTTATTVPTCTAAMLSVTAATGKPSYAPGSKPDLYLVVTNISAAPCLQNLADSQIELLVYTGDVRVWGSHDCQVQPGTDVEALTPKKAIRRAVIWSGQTSAPSCAGTRLVSSPGNYTLVAKLAGKQSAPASFVLAAT